MQLQLSGIKYLSINTIWHNLVLWLELEVISSAKFSESPEEKSLNIYDSIKYTLQGDELKLNINQMKWEWRGIPLPANNDLLTTRELKLSTTESLLSMLAVAVLASNGKKNLTNGDSCTSSLWLTKSTSHPSLEPISSGTWKHLVNSKNMEGMNSNPQMKRIFPSKFCHVLVTGNTSCFQSFTWNILFLPTHKMNTEGEFINTLLLHSNIINPNLGIRNTATKSRFGIRLVLDLAVTSSRSCKTKCKNNEKR